MATIEEQLNHYAVKVNNGSGCIFQPDTTGFSYVLTVRHNIEKEVLPGSGERVIEEPQEINVVRTKAYGSVRLNVLAVYTDQENDVAMLVVDYVGAFGDELMHARPYRDEELRLFGFPNISVRTASNTANIICRCDLVQVPDVSYEVVATPVLHTFNQGAAQTVIGFSGSGIFCIAGERLILKGIFPSLRHNDGALNKLNAFFVEPFNRLALAHGIPELMPEGMCSFRQYEGLVLNSNVQRIRNAVRPHISAIVASPITPKLVSNTIKGNLSVPYAKNYNDIVNNPRLWKAWLELLTFLDIVTDQPDYTLKTFLRNIRLYHSQHKMVIEEMIMELLLDQPSMDAVHDNDVIVFSGKSPSANKYLSKEKVKKIVGSIYQQGNDIPGIYIDNADKEKSFCCIDMAHFAEKIGAVDTTLSSEEIRAFIRIEILEILNYGHN